MDMESELRLAMEVCLAGVHPIHLARQPEKMCQHPYEPRYKPMQSAIWRTDAEVKHQYPVIFYLELCNRTTNNIVSFICLAL
ncbi:unnamed protein product [Caretta caretta]